MIYWAKIADTSEFTFFLQFIIKPPTPKVSKRGVRILDDPAHEVGKNTQDASNQCSLHYGVNSDDLTLWVDIISFPLVEKLAIHRPLC